MILPLLEIAAAAALTIAAACDMRSRIIPDTAAATVLLSGALAVFATAGSGWDYLMPIVLAAALFAAGTICFAAGALGGGDVKLLTAFGLWLTPASIAPFLILVAIAGGILGVLVLVHHRLRVVSGRSVPDAAEPAATVPYGVAIAVSGLFILFGAQ